MAEPREPGSAENTSEAHREGAVPADDRPQFHVVDKRFWVAREGEENGQDSAASAPATRLPTYLEQLQEQLAEKDRLLRTHVATTRQEQEELRRRLTRDLEQRLQLATGDLLADFLPVLDNLERALQSAEQGARGEALFEGINLVRSQFLTVLGRYGLHPIDRLGQTFDPSLDEAIAMVEVSDSAQHNLVLQEWQKGYTLHEKVLRPAKVAVGRMLAED
jgi:molecular chaperone GrpE